MRVYGDVQSGNCYKVKLLLSLLSIDYQWVAVDILAGETKTKQFLAKNANGKIPLLELVSPRITAITSLPQTIALLTRKAKCLGLG